MRGDVDYMLIQWGIWVRTQVGVPRYVSPAWAMMRDNLQSPGDPDPDISEDEALVVDRAMARLYRGYPEAGMAVWNYYRYQGMTMRRLAVLMGVSKAKADELIKVGCAYVAGSMERHAA